MKDQTPTIAIVRTDGVAPKATLAFIEWEDGSTSSMGEGTGLQLLASLSCIIDSLATKMPIPIIRMAIENSVLGGDHNE